MLARQAYLRRARHWITNRGWRGFLQEILWRAKLKLKGQPIPGQPGPEKGPHPFDVAYGVDTAGLVWGESLAGVAEDTRGAQYWATGYYGVAPSSFDNALQRLALDWHSYTFVDIGCGKGRALLLALRFPFQEAIGVELSPELATAARGNVERFTAPWRDPSVPCRVVAADATTFPLPAGPLLLHLYHPFAAPVMARFLEHVHQALRAEERPLWLLYTNPELGAMLEATPFLEKVWDGHFPMSGEDAAADRFGSDYERVVAYRATGS